MQESNFEFSELISAFTNRDPFQNKDPIKLIMYVEKIVQPCHQLKTISTFHLTLQQALDYALGTERIFSAGRHTSHGICNVF